MMLERSRLRPHTSFAGLVLSEAECVVCVLIVDTTDRLLDITSRRLHCSTLNCTVVCALMLACGEQSLSSLFSLAFAHITGRQWRSVARAAGEGC